MGAMGGGREHHHGGVHRASDHSPGPISPSTHPRHHRVDAPTYLGVGTTVERRGRDDVVPRAGDERGDGEELRGLPGRGGHRQDPA